MATHEERLKILTMLQDNIINAEQAAKLLEALNTPSSATNTTNEPATNPAGGKRGEKYFRVRVTDSDSGKTRVNIRLPVGLVGAGMKMGMKFSPEIEGIDTNVLKDLLEKGESGKIIDVYDDNDGEHVEIFIE